MANRRQFESTHYADGVSINRCWGGSDIFRGSASALVACGLVRDDQLPGRPGNGVSCCSYHPDGTKVVRAGMPKKNRLTPGGMSVRKMGADRHEIRVRVSDEEAKHRMAEHDEAEKQHELAVANALLERSYQLTAAATARSAATPQRRPIPSTWRVITNPNWQARASI